MGTHRFAVLLAAAILSAAEFPNPASDLPQVSGKQTAVFAGGCFWCTEAVFESLAGVENVVSGYAGGKASDAKYDLVSNHKTDHAEVIQVTYNPAVITFGTLLKIFFSVAHDPTQFHRQGPDWGRQYRSAVFVQNAEEKRIAEAYIKQLDAAKVFTKPIVTEIVPLSGFYPAEAYHQDFVRRNPGHPYVVVNAIPKLEKLKKNYSVLIRRK
ncbi:MAG: peptide-methionine (S)-S-oxide reductase MsrA [Bryobacterales bacterium]|nr:peptide-methionine (S)-S-oxide reductase MsrA [Bryobacterales bacterium]